MLMFQYPEGWKAFRYLLSELALTINGSSFNTPKGGRPSDTVELIALEDGLGGSQAVSIPRRVEGLPIRGVVCGSLTGIKLFQYPEGWKAFRY